MIHIKLFIGRFISTVKRTETLVHFTRKVCPEMDLLAIALQDYTISGRDAT